MKLFKAFLLGFVIGNVLILAAKDHHDHAESITHKMKEGIKEFAHDTRHAISQATDKVKHVFTEKSEEAQQAAHKASDAVKHTAQETVQEAKAIAHKTADKIKGTADRTQQEAQEATLRVHDEVAGISFTGLAKSAFLTLCTGAPLAVAYYGIHDNFNNISRFSDEKAWQSLLYAGSIGCITCALVTLQKAYTEYKNALPNDVEINIKN